MIVKRLYEIQERDGYLRPDAMKQLAADMGLKVRRLHEVASFFPHFLQAPPPAVEVKVCRDMACDMNGAEAMTAEVSSRLSHHGKANVQVGWASCLGRCDRPPGVRINDCDASPMDADTIVSVVDDLLRLASARSAWEQARSKGTKSSDPAPPDPRRRDVAAPLIAARRSPPPAPDGAPADWLIDIYRGGPTYAVLQERLGPAEVVLKQLEKAGLLGLGGPGARTYKKWSEVREAEGDPKYVVCNGDESEPGTFKDREILNRAPHLVVEGMAIAAKTIGAARGFVYIRHEYEDAIRSTRAAIRAAYEAGALGRAGANAAASFDLEVFVSPGGYICGEQTALIEAMEGHRGEPRNRPPELQVKGLFGKPTLVNNVETFAWVPYIVNDGGEAYLRDGRNGSRGRRFFSISGDVTQPGVHEVPVGLTVRELIALAGGLSRGLKALATSGPSGGFLPARPALATLPRSYRDGLKDQTKADRPLAGKIAEGATDFDVLDLELDIEVFRKLNLALGAGIVVYGEGRNMAEAAVNCSRFFRDESCGKCVPCRLGTQRVVELGEALSGATPSVGADAGRGLVGELHSVMTQASICGLGQVAANPLRTALDHFRADFQEAARSDRVAEGVAHE